MGSLLAALGSWLVARSAGGAWLLRVEDLDPPREKSGAAAAQLDALSRLGFVPDGPVVYQSERGADYELALQYLLERELAFPCRCSRADLEAFGGIHRRCVPRPSGVRPAYRVRVPAGVIEFQDQLRGSFRQDLASEVGDFVIRRADGPWAYQLAVVVDDASQAITEVVRGADLLDSTPRQILLQRLLGYPTPAYSHLPVLRSADGNKLSKSIGSASLDLARPLNCLRQAFAWLGQDESAMDPALSPAQALSLALAGFEPNRLPRSDRVLG